jgi:hypothetical protein
MNRNYVFMQDCEISVPVRYIGPEVLSETTDTGQELEPQYLGPLEGLPSFHFLAFWV